jgi:1-acyl-sn-glycerol-3-phosphate acyltransferase
VKVVGTPRRAHVLYLANHVSWLDIMIIAGASGAAFVAKSEIRKWPGIGWLCGLNNTVFIERAERGNVRGQADAMRDALLAGQPLGLFPEGTTDGGGEVLPFRAALVSSVFPPLPGITVQPVAIDYGAAVGDIAWVGEEPAAANMKRVLSRKGTMPVTLHFLEAIDPAACADRKVLAQRARDEIVAALKG